MNAADLHRAEWAYNKGAPDGPPQLGIALSGGGNRSAVFCIGVLKALHEQGVLGRVDVISAVSGGSYALSWLLLQPYYAWLVDSAAPEQALARMFDPEDVHQRYLEDRTRGMVDVGSRLGQGVIVGLTTLFDMVIFNVLRLVNLPFGRSAEFAATSNASNMTRLRYRKGLQKTYHVLPDERGKARNEHQDGFLAGVVAASEFLDLAGTLQPVTIPDMAAFAGQHRMPAFVFNATVSPPRAPKDGGPGAAMLKRVFEITPVGFGSDSCGWLRWDQTDGGWEPGKGKRRILKRKEPSPYATVRCLNVAPAISGAAFSAATYHKSRAARRAIQFLNIGLEYRVPNPSEPKRIIRLGDGGHSENLGALALLRRGCASMLIVDAEQDERGEFNAYHDLVAGVKRDLELDLRVAAIDRNRPLPSDAVYRGVAGDHDLFYLKLPLDQSAVEGWPASVKEYAAAHPDFPQEPTADQYFEPEQYRAYRDLGYHLAMTSPTLADFGAP